MTPNSRSNLWIGLAVFAFAAFATFVWIPLDTDTGLIEKVRRRVAIGDALAPTAACAFLFVGGLLLMTRERNASDQPVITPSQLLFFARLVGIIVIGVFMMRYTGPIVAELSNLVRAEPVEYRLLRATPGWKHVGFVTGGVFLVAGMIAVVERKLTRRALLTALIAVLVMIAIFDLPFEDLQLPPNGDV